MMWHKFVCRMTCLESMDERQNPEGMIQTSGYFRMKVIDEELYIFRVAGMSIECTGSYV